MMTVFDNAAMTDATAFFTTVTQGTAAIAGILVGFRAVQYQLERQRRQENTDTVRTELRRLRKQHHDRINSIVRGFEANLESHIEYDTSAAFAERTEPVSEATPPEEFDPESTDRFRAHDEFAFVSPMGPNEETLNALVRELNTISWLFDQLTPKRDARPRGLLEFAEIQRLQRATTNAAVLYSEFVDGFPDDGARPHWADQEWELLTLSDDVVELVAMGRRSSLRPMPELRTMFYAAVGLLSTGVFLPLLLLMTPPIPFGPLSDRVIFLLQSVILAGVIVFVLLLLSSILSNVGDGRLSREEDA